MMKSRGRGFNETSNEKYFKYKGFERLYFNLCKKYKRVLVDISRYRLYRSSVRYIKSRIKNRYSKVCPDRDDVYSSSNSNGVLDLRMGFSDWCRRRRRLRIKSDLSSYKCKDLEFCRR